MHEISDNRYRCCHLLHTSNGFGIRVRFGIDVYEKRALQRPRASLTGAKALRALW